MVRETPHLAQSGSWDASPPHALSAVRRAGEVAVRSFLIAGGVGGGAILVGYAAFALNSLLALAERMRIALGVSPPSGGPDLLLLSVAALFIVCPVGALAALWGKYHALWSRRLLALWPDRSAVRAHARLPAFSELTPDTQVEAQKAYLRALIETPSWRTLLGADHPGSMPDVPQPGSTNAQYAAAAEKCLRAIEADIAERALTTGLVVGISQNRIIDHLTILVAALELQLHVLARLGRRPGLTMWYELLTRAGSSLFANTYLNREQVFGLSYVTKSIATGMTLLSDGLEDIQLDEAFDTVEDALRPFATGDVSGAVINSALLMGELGAEGAISIGATGLNLMAQLIEKHGDDMLQGVLSGGMLYYHGMALASRSLALDSRHLHSPAMTRTPFACMEALARQAGAIVLSHVRQRRQLLRDKRRQALDQIPGVKRVFETTGMLGKGVVGAASWLSYRFGKGGAAKSGAGMADPPPPDVPAGDAKDAGILAWLKRMNPWA